MSLVITFTSCDVNNTSCVFNDGTNTYTISNLEAYNTDNYEAGGCAAWEYMAVVTSGTTGSGESLYSQQGLAQFSGGDNGSEYIYYVAFYLSNTNGSPANIDSYAYIKSTSSGVASIPLEYLSSDGKTVDFNNTTITANSTTTPSSWSFGPESDYADISGNTTGSTTCIMTFYSNSSSTNIQDVGIAGAAAGVYELINQTGPQTLNSGYIASIALLFYSSYNL